jgi:hypothetical protein
MLASAWSRSDRSVGSAGYHCPTAPLPPAMPKRTNVTQSHFAAKTESGGSQHVLSARPCCEPRPELPQSARILHSAYRAPRGTSERTTISQRPCPTRPCAVSSCSRSERIWRAVRSARSRRLSANKIASAAGLFERGAPPYRVQSVCRASSQAAHPPIRISRDAERQICRVRDQQVGGGPQQSCFLV